MADELEYLGDGTVYKMPTGEKERPFMDCVNYSKVDVEFKQI